MAYENIRLTKQNVTMVGGYFYMMDHDTDSLIVKTDDGTQAYSYPLDTTISTTILSLEHDGYNFWSLEDGGGNDMTIRRWYLDNYVCKLRQTINLVANASHSFSSQAFTVEHYHTQFSAGEAIGQTILSIEDGSELSSGYTVVLGPNTADNAIEEFQVSSATNDSVSINGTITRAYAAGDPISFYKTIWLFNDFDGTDSSTGALYQINAYTGGVQTKTAGGAYQSVQACTFFDIPYYVFNPNFAPQATPKYNSICYVKTSNMLFLDPDDLANGYGSMAMDNVHSDQASVLDIYDLTIDGTNVYRLQRDATYYGSTTTFADNTYNYQLSTLKSFVTSVSLRADPAILPANDVNQALITAIVKDQFNLPVVGRTVEFTEDDGVDDQDQLSLSQTPTDSDGVAEVYYTAGNTAREVRITATVNQS
ncbi:MAG: hypothetical protein DRP42_01490 [Tenericutes bacterium]|nr:MAG: hypothetical protein DRP42_01490 [Mycoplasmatota bacterium]